MKFLISIILSLYIFFLAVQPALEVINFSKTECCSQSCEYDCDRPTSEKKQQDNSCNGTCNPFMSCNCCVGFIISLEHFSLPIRDEISVNNSFYKLNEVPEIEIPIWQPPKIS